MNPGQAPNAPIRFRAAGNRLLLSGFRKGRRNCQKHTGVQIWFGSIPGLAPGVVHFPLLRPVDKDMISLSEFAKIDLPMCKQIEERSCTKWKNGRGWVT